jgi:hypothetical protein
MEHIAIAQDGGTPLTSAATLLLFKKPVNQLFQGRFALCQAQFWFLTIAIARIVNNYAPKISNTYKPLPIALNSETRSDSMSRSKL